MLMKIWKRGLKRLDVLDITLIKFAMIAVAFFLVTIWPAAMNWVQSVNPWYFLAAAVLLGAKSFYKVYIKK